MYTAPVQLINKCVDCLFAVLFENSLTPVILGLIVAACVVATLVKISR